MHLRECGEKMPPQIAWSYWREEAALIIERVIYCPGCSGSLLSLPGFPFSPRSGEAPTQKHEGYPELKKRREQVSPRCPCPSVPPHRIARRAGPGLPAGFPARPFQRLRQERAAPWPDHPELWAAAAAPRLGNHRGEQGSGAPLGTGSARGETAPHSLGYRVQLGSKIGTPD